MIRDTRTFPVRKSIFQTKSFSPAEKEMLQALHALCAQRAALTLPDMHASVGAYAEHIRLDALIAEQSQNAPASLKDLLSEQTSRVLNGEAQMVQAVWQSWLISNPHMSQVQQ